MTQGKDAKIPGDELGTYHVISHIDDSSCGPGAMGSEDVWEFDVKLSRAGRDLFWLNGREAIPGRIAADGVSFVLDSEVVAEIRPKERGNPGCTLQRLDQASGKLGAPGSDVLDFEGRLRFGYLPTPGSDCSELLGVPGGFFSLPCEMSYRMSATRSAAPR